MARKWQYVWSENAILRRDANMPVDVEVYWPREDKWVDYDMDTAIQEWCEGSPIRSKEALEEAIEKVRRRSQ